MNSLPLSTFRSDLMRHLKEYVVNRNTQLSFHPSFESITDTVAKSSTTKVQLLTVEKLKSFDCPIQSSIFNLKNNNNQNDICNEFQKRNYMLICKLTEHFGSGTDYGSIFFEDLTGVIKCEIPIKYLKKSFKYLGNFVLVTSWNYIHLAECSYLEVTGKLIPLDDDQLNSQINISVVSGNSASVLLHNRLRVDSGLINIKATVEAVSEVFRVKKEWMFVVLLTGGSVIVIRNKLCLFWQKFIILHEDHVFTNLRPTTLQKGSNGIRDVFIPWKDSAFHYAGDCNCLELSPEEWLKMNCNTSFTELEHTQMEDRLSSDNKAFSFQGTVTSTQFLDAGIVELDAKVRLYLCGLPACPYIASLREGCKISISSVHHHPADKGSGVIKLYTCMRSSIKFSQFSPSKKYRMIQCFPVTKSLKHSILPYDVVDLMVQFWVHICSCFPYLNRNQMYSMYKYLIEKFKVEDHRYEKRNLMEEFLAVSHACYASKKIDISKPQLLTVAVLKSSIQDKNSDIEPLAAGKQSCSTQEANENRCWNYVISQSDAVNQLLIGKLGVGLNGRMFLEDSTGRIDLMISDDTVNEHICDQQCFDKPEPRKVLCPRAHLSVIDFIVILSEYSLIQENVLSKTFPPSKMVSNRQLQDGSEHHTYLQCSMADICIVNRFETLVCSGSYSKCSQEPKTKKSKLQQEVCQPACILFTVNYKEGLNVENTFSQPKLRFCALGTYQACEHENEPDFALPSTSTGRTGIVQNVISSKERTACTERELQNSVAVVFQNDNVRYFPVIHPGGVYHVLCKGGISVNKHLSTTNIRLQKKIQTSDTSKFIQLSNKCSIERVRIEDDKRNNSPNPIGFSNIEDILNESFRDGLVSFRGRITRRIHKESYADRDSSSQYVKKEASECAQKLGFSALQEKCIVLNVRDLNSEKELQVYMNLQDKGYPLGILPGAVIEFTRLERKVSRIRTVYCQYIVVSNVTVISLFPQTGSTAGVSSEISQDATGKNIPFCYLMELWQGDRDPKSKFSSVVFLQKVMKLSLKAVCQTCGSQFHKDICSNASCHSLLPSKLLARLSFIVDDGTSVAMVSCIGGQIQTVMQLSDAEWLSLHQEVVKSCSEIFWSQHHQQSDCDLHSFIRILCDSPSIKKQWNMVFSVRTSVQKENKGVSSKYCFRDLEVDDLLPKCIDVSDGQIETKCLPFLQLECHAVKEVDHQNTILHFLQ